MSSLSLQGGRVQSVQAVEYHDPPPDPWSPILRLVAIITFFYAAANLGQFIPTAARIIGEFPRASWMPTTTRQYWFWAVSIQELLVIAGALVVGAIVLLRSGSYQLLVWGSWTLLILWAVEIVSTWFLLSPNLRSYSMFIYSFLYDAQNYFFPLLVILVLRAHHLRYVHAATGEENPSPWPRLGRVVAMLSMIFGLIVAVRAAFFVHWQLMTPAHLGGGRDAMHEAIQKLRLASGIFVGVAGLLVIGAAARLWIWERSHRLVMIAVNLWIAIWTAELAITGYFRLQRFQVFYGVSDLLRGILPTVFPLMLLLMLREYSTSLARPSGSAPGASVTPPPGHIPPPHLQTLPATVPDTGAPH